MSLIYIKLGVLLEIHIAENESIKSKESILYAAVTGVTKEPFGPYIVGLSQVFIYNEEHEYLPDSAYLESNGTSWRLIALWDGGNSDFTVKSLNIVESIPIHPVMFSELKV